MQYVPPPLFKQGTPARVKVAVYIFAAIVMLMVDSRLHALVEVRQAVGFVLYPFQKAAMLPRDAVYAIGDYFASLHTLQEEVEVLRKRELENAQILQTATQLATENAHLRQLLKLNERLPVKSLPAEILSDARTSYARKVILNKGSHDGVILGQPVIDENGVIGQVTQVFVNTSEVTLLTDKDQAIPVQAARTGIRSIAYGRGQTGYLELRFMEPNADVQAGDVLVTSGIDGLYPPGLAVGEVVDVSDRGATFNHIACRPLAGLDKSRQVLVLMPNTVMETTPETDEVQVKAHSQADVEAARKKAGIK